MSAPVERPEQPAGTSCGRRIGYVLAIVANAVLLVLINRWPGWQSLGFLTDDAAGVVDWVNASIAVGMAVNVVYLVRDAPAVRALGDVVTTALAVVVLARALAVFPFDFSEFSVDWAPWLRAALWFLVVVTGIGLLVNVARLLRLGSR